MKITISFQISCADLILEAKGVLTNFGVRFEFIGLFFLFNQRKKKSITETQLVLDKLKKVELANFENKKVTSLINLLYGLFLLQVQSINFYINISVI